MLDTGMGSLLYQQLAPAIQQQIQPVQPYSGGLVRALTNQSGSMPNFSQMMEHAPGSPFLDRNSPANIATMAMRAGALGGQNLLNRLMVPAKAGIANAENALSIAGQQQQIDQALAQMGNSQYLSDVRIGMDQRDRDISQLMAYLSPMFNSMFESM